jgi:spermidine synthase
MQPQESGSAIKINKKLFSFAGLVLPAIPTYFGGFFALALVSKKINPLKIEKNKIAQKIKRLKLETKYYNSEIHFSSFVLPNYIKNNLN